ncbi:LPXTG cell wall anchor domain-containing protein [Streptomyces puniciscabiei]
MKIHKSATAEYDERNEPHVCSFCLDAFHFDGGQQVDWRIEVWAPTGGTKHKVFWTNCRGSGGGAPSSGPSAGPSSAPSGSSSSVPSSPSSSSSSSPSSPSASAPGSSSSSAPAPSSSPSAQGGGGGLAETGNGVPVGALSGAAAGLVGAGGYLALRRRKTRG